MKKKYLNILLAVFFGIAIFSLIGKFLYARKSMAFTFDAAYYWPNKLVSYGQWLYEKTPAGHEYYLYLPEKYRNDRNNENAKLPLIVVFHGSDERGVTLYKYGRSFITKDFQDNVYPEGVAVLVILSRINYFTDPHSTSLLIQNIVLKNACIDQKNIVGWGFSQGAKFVVELACEEPRLFKAVISGSGFYNISIKELISVLPVQFYSAVSENDKGIYEQGSRVGKLCGKWCKNSRYVQYEKRWHFYVEMNDKTGKKNRDLTDETCFDWLKNILSQ